MWPFRTSHRRRDEQRAPAEPELGEPARVRSPYRRYEYRALSAGAELLCDVCRKPGCRDHVPCDRPYWCLRDGVPWCDTSVRCRIMGKDHEGEHEGVITWTLIT